MKLKDYIEQLQQFVKENPESADKRVVYAKDDEGNGFGSYFYSPTKANFGGNTDHYDEVKGKKYDSVIIN